MNLGAAMSKVSPQAMSYEPKIGVSTAEVETTFEDVAGFIATLPDTAEKDLAWYALTGEERERDKCAFKVVMELGLGMKHFDDAVVEIEAVVNELETTNRSEAAYRIAQYVMGLESDFLFRLRSI